LINSLSTCTLHRLVKLTTSVEKLSPSSLPKPSRPQRPEDLLFNKPLRPSQWGFMPKTFAPKEISISPPDMDNDDKGYVEKI